EVSTDELRRDRFESYGVLLEAALRAEETSLERSSTAAKRKKFIGNLNPIPGQSGAVSFRSSGLQRGWYRGRGMGQTSRSPLVSSGRGGLTRSNLGEDRVQLDHSVGRSIPSCANCGSTCSFISHDFASSVHTSIESLGHDLCVSMPDGGVILVNTVVRSCSIIVEGVTLYADLVVINLRELDVIFGMDWLSCNHTLVGCPTKDVAVEVSGQMRTVIMGERKVMPNCLISIVTAFNLIKEGCEAYLSSVHDVAKVSVGVSDVLVVREFPDVFSKELPGLPPHREVDFEIETIPGVAPVSIAPYRMART
ncbi:UNVERIFIED_CONTAM: hypothetical protein Sangu_3253000, partial [Sesamum angustifolium]